MLYKSLLMFILPVATLLADENISSDKPNYQAISSGVSSTVIQIVKEQSDSIQHFDKERLYLKGERIFLTRTGPLLYNGQSSILLPALFSDQSGYYLPCRNRDDYRLTCSNPDCGETWWFSDNWSIHCPACGSIGN